MFREMELPNPIRISWRLLNESLNPSFGSFSNNQKKGFFQVFGKPKVVKVILVVVREAEYWFMEGK